MIAVEKTLTSKFSAVEMVNEVSAILGGKGGGGRPDMAQGGGTDVGALEPALADLPTWVSDQLA